MAAALYYLSCQKGRSELLKDWDLVLEEEAVVVEREAETATQHDDEEETGTLWSSSYYSESGSDEESVEKVVVPPVVTLLTESPTETLLCIRGRCVAVDAKEVKSVEKANVAYEASLDLKKNNPDKYVTRHAQTLSRGKYLLCKGQWNIKATCLS